MGLSVQDEVIQEEAPVEDDSDDDRLSKGAAAGSIFQVKDEWRNNQIATQLWGCKKFRAVGSGYKYMSQYVTVCHKLDVPPNPPKLLTGHYMFISWFSTRKRMGCGVPMGSHGFPSLAQFQVPAKSLLPPAAVPGKGLE